MNEEEKTIRKAKLIAIALFSLLYDLKNGVVFEEGTTKLAESYGILLEVDLDDEVMELCRETTGDIASE